MEFLKEVLGDDYENFKTKLDAYNGNEENKDKLIKLANLASGEYVGKGKYEALETDLNSKNAELTSANALIEEMKKATSGNEELQNKIASYEAKITELQEALNATQLENAFKIALLEEHANDIDYLTFKAKANNNELSLDENGKISGIEDIITSLKTQFPNQFDNTAIKKIQENKLEEKENSSSSITKDELMKKSYAERNQLFNENPEAYREIMNNE